MAIKLRIGIIMLALAALQAFAGEEEWGWGAIEEAPAPTPARIPFFDEVLAKHLLDGDFKFIADTDSINYYLTRSLKANGSVFMTFLAPDSALDLLSKVYAYLASDAWDNDLKKIDPKDAPFIKVIVYNYFIQTDKRYVQIQIDQIEDKKQREYLENLFNIRQTRDALRNNAIYMIMGFGASFFSNGAQDMVSPGPLFSMGFGGCVGMFCGEFQLGGIITAPLKDDVVQSNITYSKEDISLTAAEFLLKAKLFTTLDFEISVFSGLRIHSFEFNQNKDEIYKEFYGKGMKNGYSYDCTSGISAVKYFFGSETRHKILGIGLRAGVSNIEESTLDIHGLEWFVNLDLLLYADRAR